MSKFYGFDTYQPDDTVRIASYEILVEFVRTWDLHHPLQPDQVPCGGQTAQVASSSMYHGADILYELEGMPGIWHQHLLSFP
jgi:hypothetical protein